jgi:hypothetical protein
MKKKKLLPEDAKIIQFPSLGHLAASLTVKLNFDDVTKFWFFNEYVKAYLSEDPDLMPFVNKIKESSMLARKFRLKKTKALRKKEQEVINRFGLNPNDIENIFDLIEDEGEL